MNEQIVIILTLISILTFTLIKYNLQRNLFYSDIFAIYWSIMLLAVALSSYAVYLNGVGLAVIFLCWLVCIFSELMFVFTFVKNPNAVSTSSHEPRLNVVFIKKIILIFSMIYFFGVAALVNQYYSLPKLLSNPLNFLEAATAIGSARYITGDYSEPLIYKLGVYLLYIQVALIGCFFGYNARNNSKKIANKLLLCLVVFNVLLNSVIKTQRGILIICFLIFLSYFLAYASRQRMILTSQIQRKLIRVVFIFLALFVCLYLVLQVIREGTGSQYSTTDLLDTLISAILGSLPAFMAWVDSSNIFTVSSYGEFTFNGPGKLLFTFPDRKPGLFGDVIWLGDTYRTGTTVYTIFRALISDFSLVGAGVFFSILSAAFMITSFTKRHYSHVNSCVQAMLLLILFMSFLASPFVWLGLFIMFLAVPLLLISQDLKL